jgi:hypothetical protein
MAGVPLRRDPAFSAWVMLQSFDPLKQARMECRVGKFVELIGACDGKGFRPIPGAVERSVVEHPETTRASDAATWQRKPQEYVAVGALYIYVALSNVRVHRHLEAGLLAQAPALVCSLVSHLTRVPYGSGGGETRIIVARRSISVSRSFQRNAASAA